jgi:MFS family permease
LFPIPIITLFWKDEIGMSLTDVMVLQAIFGAAVVFFEFPSGYFADRVGHRASIVVGAALWAVSWIVYASAATFAGVVLAELVGGAGIAFISGADRALMWASLDQTGRRREYPRWESRLRAAAQTSEALSAAAGGWLYAIAPRLPFWLQVPVGALTVATAVGMREKRRTPSVDERSHVVRALQIARFTLWHHRRLQAAMALSVALGLSTFVMVWLIQPYMQARGIPEAWFGPLWTAAHVWLIAVSLAYPRVVAALGVRATLLGCCVLIPLGYAGLAVSASAWGVIFYLCFMTIRGLQGPILVNVMQEDAPPGDRASVLSLAALLFRLAFVLAGPPIGALVDHAGMETACAILAVVLTGAALTAFALFTRAHATARWRDGRTGLA